MYPIVDGDIRHHSKQISVGSQSLIKKIARINVKNRAKALALTAQMGNDITCLSPAVQIKMEKQRLIFEKELSSSERLIAHPFPINFYQSLINDFSVTTLHLVNNFGGEVYPPIKPDFKLIHSLSKD